MIYRRTKFEIINILLNKLKVREKTGLYKTKLIQESNLSGQGFPIYFKLIIDKGLIEKKDKKIFITKKGKDYLKKSNLLIVNEEKLNKDLNLDLDNISYDSARRKEKYDAKRNP